MEHLIMYLFLQNDWVVQVAIFIGLGLISQFSSVILEFCNGIF
jgi:hypothetical protein